MNPVTETEKEILAVLLDLEAKVAQMKSGGPKPNLIALFNRLDELTAKLPKNAEPDLLHYLHRKSYEKARLFLQGREAENQKGSCRH
jgi:hypothetical protein